MEVYKSFSGALGLVLLCSSAFAQLPNSDMTLKETHRAERLSNGHYKLSLPSAPAKLYIGKSADQIDYSKPLVVSGDTSIEANRDERLFFAAVGHGDTSIFSERKLNLSGTANFRDLGGIRTVHGRHVKWAKFYRADELGAIPETDFPYFESTGIKHVYDLRTTEEVEKKRDVLPNSMNWIHFPIFEENGTAQMQAVMQQFGNGNITTDNAKQLLLSANQDFAEARLPVFEDLVKKMMDDQHAAPLPLHRRKRPHGLHSSHDTFGSRRRSGDHHQ